mgnify:CR=1 FL=1
MVEVWATIKIYLLLSNQGSDIDTLCVAPKHVKREDFLEHMYDVLKARSEVTEITAVPEAYVPIIKMVFSGISVCLL